MDSAASSLSGRKLPSVAAGFGPDPSGLGLVKAIENYKSFPILAIFFPIKIVKYFSVFSRWSRLCCLPLSRLPLTSTWHPAKDPLPVLEMMTSRRMMRMMKTVFSPRMSLTSSRSGWTAKPLPKRFPPSAISVAVPHADDSSWINSNIHFFYSGMFWRKNVFFFNWFFCQFNWIFFSGPPFSLPRCPDQGTHGPGQSCHRCKEGRYGRKGRQRFEGVCQDAFLSCQRSGINNYEKLKTT